VSRPLRLALSALLPLSLAVLAWPAGASAQEVAPPPALLVKGTDRSEPLELRTVAIEARVVGHLAETRMTLTFHNPQSRALAGDLYVPLPAAATVTGYALDVNGAMVDGVVVEKEEARRIFEAEVRKGVDPGLVEWVGANTFRTRVFPIPANGERTVRVDTVAAIEDGPDGPRWRLPLDFRSPVAAFRLRVEVVKPGAAPKVVAGGPAGLAFAGWQENFVAEATLSDEPLDADLVVGLPAVESRRVRVEAAADGSTYFALRDRLEVPPAAAAAAVAAPRSIRLLWDASASRERADHAREIAFLRAYFGSLEGGPVAVDLIPFRDAAEVPRRFTLPAQLAELTGALEALPYDGGTQLAAIAPPSGAEAPDLVLLFTDGVSTFGRPDPGESDAPLYVLNTAAAANHAFLRHLAQSGGGAYLDLSAVRDEQALAAVGRPAFSFLRARVTDGGADEIYPRSARPVHGSFSLAGRLEGERATVVVEYGTGGKATVTHTFVVERAQAGTGELLRRDWALKKVDELLVFPKENAAALTVLGKDQGIVTPGTSLLVLERLDQYVQYRVRPPASLPELRAAFDEQVEALAAEEKASREARLERVLGLWRARVEWWETKFDVPAGFRYADAKEKATAGHGDDRTRMEERPAPGMAPAAEPAPAETTVELEGRGGAAVAKKDAAKGGDGRADEAVGAAIALAPWNPQTPYLAAIRAAAKPERYAVYLAQRKEFGTSPAFFLDCSDWFRQEGDAALSLRILSNIAELQLEDPALLRVLAHRLAQLDHLDLAIGAFEEVLVLRPEEPQSYRDLALVLARRADGAAAMDAPYARKDYARALELLAEVVMGAWDRFAEIETIALEEFNRILPRAKEAGAKEVPLDARLVKLLDVDIRIVMTWDADMTDMDLHVVEPSGEEAYYSHNRTTIGGAVSRDFTQGYGPEVYALRKGMHGTYTVRTKFYGSSAATVQGAVTLQVDVFTNYGRPSEQRKSLTFRLTETKEMFTVGEIEL